MCAKFNKSCVLIYAFFIIVLSLDRGYATTLLATKRAMVTDDPIAESLEEINEFNESNILRDSAPVGHHMDEDSAFSDRLNEILGKMKQDVEILESNDPDLIKDKDELEERYRGNSIVVNTDEFINENIEMNAAEDKADQESLATSHMILSIILVVVALVSVGLYAGLVMWRSHIEQRYGMRELLVTNDNRSYWPQHTTDLSAQKSHIVAVEEQQQQQQQQIQDQESAKCEYNAN